MRSTVFTVAVLLAGCAAEPSAEAPRADAGSNMAAPQEAAASNPAPAAATPASDASARQVVVYKTEGCGCCEGWIEHLQAAGYRVDARNTLELMAVKADAGVPQDLSSCHTALVDGYVVEGHVPADVVERLLRERPDAAGIAVPGMPVGSPGMEGPNPRPYDVVLFRRDGSREVYATVDPRR